MANWSDGYVNSNGIKIHYYRTGGDKPKVIFNHGAGDDGLCWTHVVKELENDYDVIMPDARGHGKSSNGKGDYSTQSRVSDLVGLIKELNLDHPIIGGHSMGADTTFHLAAEFPQMARAIFLEDPPLVLPGEPLFDSEQTKGKDVGKMMRQFMMLFKLMPRFIAIPMAHKGSPTYPEDEILPWVASKKRMSFDFLNSMDKLDFNVSDPLEPFDHIQVPVLLFIGDKEKTKMSIDSKSTAAAVIKRNAGIQVVQLDGATHDIRRTRFDGYMPALRQFLAENCK